VDRFSGHLSPTEGLETLGRRLLYGAVLTLVLTLLLVGSAGLLGMASPRATPAPGAVVPAAPVAPAAPLIPAVQPDLTHGDLIVSSGQVFTIQPTLGGNTYFQGGNITVLAGGTLIVRNVILSFVQFVSDVGTPQSRLSHVVHFLDQGTVKVYNSTITTDAAVLNAYVKLNLTVTGAMTTLNSTLAFPGWVTATGAGAALTLNSTLVTGNPSVRSLSESPTILGDTIWAPSILATSGAELNLFNSSLNQTYADDTTFYGMPGPAPLNASQVTIPANVTSLATPTDSANLTQDWLYPGGIGGGRVGVYYNTTGNPTESTFTVKVWYGGTGYALGSVFLVNDTTDGYAVVDFTNALTTAINDKGMLNYLNYTGSFGTTSQISVQYGLTSGAPTLATQVTVSLLPPLEYNLEVSGAGTVLNSVDTAVGLTWTGLPTSPYSAFAPFPWASNKLLVENGATAYLGNLSVPNAIPGVFSTSAVLPDSSSTVYLYRWADLNLTGRGGTIPIYGATVSAYYAYPNTQSNNATANGLNDLATASPPIWGYVHYRDTNQGYPGYATSGRSGIASILLASSVLNGTTLPDGGFLGAYHFGVFLPIPTNNSRWFNWSVSPFPVGVAFGTAGYSGPDWGPNQHFPQYYAGAAITKEVISTNGTGVGPRIGQDLTFTTTVTSIGPAPITSAIVSLVFEKNTTVTEPKLIAVPLTQQNSNYTFALSWTINETVIGDHSEAVNSSFTVFFLWNPGNVSGLSGITNSSHAFLVHPSQVSITVTSYPPSTLSLNDLYITPGDLWYNTSLAHSAVLIVTATPTSGGNGPVTVAEALSLPGPYTLAWQSLQQLLSPGTTYLISIEALYNGANASISFPGTYTVPGGSSSNFLNYSFLGLTIWPYWILIIAAVVVGLVAFLFVSRRQAAGKLVECGECGNLIPEDATVCPKCGAEFEADLIRCSRCSSTIPANSKICPECAALLLGTSEEAGEAAERQGYQDYTEKYRAEGKRELGENFNEGSFWDWWKRQPTYTPYNQWKLQQGQGTPRTGMSEPPAAGGGGAGEPIAALSGGAVPARPPPKGGAGGAPPPSAPPAKAAPPKTPPGTGAAPAAAGFKNCPGCGKEIPGDYLICPFCSSVVQ